MDADSIETIDDDPEPVARVAAIDIAKASAMVCTRVPSDKHPGRKMQNTFPVAATTGAILELGDHLACQGIELVVMEATGVYWKPFFYLLEDRGLTCWLVNPRDVKNVPGRPKTDKLDAIWLAKLAERGMLRASFVPPKPIRELRDLTRLREVLTADRTKYRQRVGKVLEDACIKVDDVVSDLFGVSGRDMLDALTNGQRNPTTLAELARGVMKRKKPALIQALTGRFTDHHAGQLQMLLLLHDTLTAQIDQLTCDIQALLDAIDPPPPTTGTGMTIRERLDEIPGVGPATAAVIIAEIGTDMTCFPTEDHLACWARLTPRTIQSGTREKHTKPGKGNRWLKGPLAEAATAAAPTKTFLGARWRRIAAHAPKKKATTAVARTILTYAWHIIADPNARYIELGPDWHTRHIDPARKLRQHRRELERLGYTVTLTTTT